MKNVLNIFVVDDNELYLMSLDQKLKDTLTHYNLQTFTSGEECIEKLHQHPDLIILDYLLDGQNGMETLKQIKINNPTIPVIILSKQKDIHIAMDLLHMGAYDYIEKDENAYLKLAYLINTLLEKKSLKEEVFELKIKVGKNKMMIWLLFFIILGLVVAAASTIFID